MKTKIFDLGDWNNVMNAARFTVGKPPLNKQPSKKFKMDILIAEHSPIREMSIKWIWESIPHWVGVHWVRHKWECFVATQRTDRTGINRDNLPQNEPQNFMGSANAQNLIDSWRKRLCFKASKETRELAEDFKYALIDSNELELSDVLVPNCVYRCGCPETEPCGFWDSFVKDFIDADYSLGDISNIRFRYEHYNIMFLCNDGE